MRDRKGVTEVKDATRTWQSVCGECAYYRRRLCRFGTLEIPPDDSIAAVCEGFRPAGGTPALERAAGEGGKDRAARIRAAGPDGPRGHGRSENKIT